MKQHIKLQQTQENMKAGRLTLNGFLGDDRRNLIDILLDDEAEVNRRQLTHELLAQRMRYFREQGSKGLDDFIRVDSHFEVRVLSTRGKLPCPFGERGLYQKTNTTVKNLRLGRELTFSDLSLHLIAAHGFYQGHGSFFRLNPREVAEILEISPSPTSD